jgi:hypothetical protein
MAVAERDLGEVQPPHDKERAMSTRHRHRSWLFSAFATAIGPREVAALARTVPSPGTDELVRILLAAVSAHERNQP